MNENVVQVLLSSHFIHSARNYRPFSESHALWGDDVIPLGFCMAAVSLLCLSKPCSFCTPHLLSDRLLTSYELHGLSHASPSSTQPSNIAMYRICRFLCSCTPGSQQTAGSTGQALCYIQVCASSAWQRVWHMVEGPPMVGEWTRACVLPCPPWGKSE